MRRSKPASRALCKRKTCRRRGIYAPPPEITLDQRYGARYALLFDPQTAGGLLASIAPERVADCIRELREKGYREAAVIGEAVARSAEGKAVVLRVEG